MARNQDTWTPAYPDFALDREGLAEILKRFRGIETPAYPDFALDREGAVGAPIHDPDQQTGGGSVEWWSAPPDSHLHSFRFHDARKVAFLRRFRGNVSILTVRFKPAKNNPGGGLSEYEYEFADHAQGEQIYRQMQMMAHPGEMIQELIRMRVPYRPTHK